MRTVSKGYDPVKRGKDSWLLRVSVSEDGKSSKRLNKTVHCRTKTEAKRLLEEWRVELMTARTRMDRSNKTLEEFLREHVTYLHDVKHLSANTIRGYRDIVETRWVPRLGTTLLKDLKPYMIEDQLAWMRQSGGLNGKPLSGNTCQKALSFLKTALKRARRLEYIESNPCELVDVPSKEKKEVRVIDENEVSRMKIALLGCPDYRFAAATNLALDTGMRRGELCALRWRDVDLDGGVIRVRRALAEARATDAYCGETLEEKLPKSNRSNRDVTIPEGTVEFLRHHKQMQLYRLMYNDIEQGEDTPVFCSDLGELYRPSKFTSDFSRFARHKSFAVTLHGLRHTHASLLLKKGSRYSTSPPVWATRASRSPTRPTRTSCRETTAGLRRSGAS